MQTTSNEKTVLLPQEHAGTSLIQELEYTDDGIDDGYGSKEWDDQWRKMLFVAKHFTGAIFGILLGMALARPNTITTQGKVYNPHPTIRNGFGVKYERPMDPANWDDVLKTTNSKYEKFQALNFQVYTGGAPVEFEGNVTNPECHDLSTQGTLDGVHHCYMGHKNKTQDVLDRLDIMREAVEEAYEQSSKDSDTLKIFVAPEFFFRGRNGAYVVDNVNSEEPVFNDVNGECHAAMCHILSGLEDLVADQRFEDWLFMFGTAIVSETLPKNDTYDFLFYNFGILFRGYDPNNDSSKGKRFLVPKRYVSLSDFLTPDRFNIKNNTREIYQSGALQTEIKDPEDEAEALKSVIRPNSKRYDHNLWYTYKKELADELGYIMIEYGWLQMDGILFSVEICLDHDLRSALTSYLIDSILPAPTLIPASRQGGVVEYIEIPRYQAQLSIVSSAGMTVSPTSLALTNGGSIILQDGLSDQATNMTWTYECFKYEWEFMGGAEVIQRNADMTPTDVMFHYQIHHGYTKHTIYANGDWKQQLRGVFSHSQYEPMITVYEPKPIAKIF